MKLLKRWLLGNGKNIMQASIIWNFVASMEYSFQSAVLMLAVTRCNGLYDAGIFTIAYTVTQMMSTIGSYGMRSFQVSDFQNEYSFHTYFFSRICTTFAMVGICLTYSKMQGYNNNRMILIIILCFYRVWESIEDVVHGEIQKKQRLDVGAKIESMRIFIATSLFVFFCFVTHNVMIASSIMSISAVLIMLLLNGLVLKDFKITSLRWNVSGTGRLLLVCFPLCASGFLYNYLVNAPKYAIDRNLSEESQAVFSILFMPIFIINVMSSFVYKPLMTDMGIYWNRKEKKIFLKIIIRQIVIIAGLTILIVAGGLVIGLDLLGYIYGINLAQYKMLFALLLVFGGLAALDAFFVIVLSIIRKQQWTIVAYVFALLCTWACMDKTVCTFGLWGAGILYGLIMGVIMLILMSVFFNTVYKQRKELK